MEFYCYLSFMIRHTGITTEQRKKNTKQQQTVIKKTDQKIKNANKNKTKTTKQDNSLFLPTKNQDLPWLLTSLRCNSQLHGLFTGGKLCAWSASVRGYSNARIAEGTASCVSLRRYGCFPMGFPATMMTLQKLWSHKLEISTLNNPSLPFSPKWWHVTYNRSKRLLLMARIQVMRKSRDQLRFQTNMSNYHPTAHGRCYRTR